MQISLFPFTTEITDLYSEGGLDLKATNIQDIWNVGRSSSTWRKKLSQTVGDPQSPHRTTSLRSELRSEPRTFSLWVLTTEVQLRQKKMFEAKSTILNKNLFSEICCWWCFQTAHWIMSLTGLFSFIYFCTVSFYFHLISLLLLCTALLFFIF